MRMIATGMLAMLLSAGAAGAHAQGSGTVAEDANADMSPVDVLPDIDVDTYDDAIIDPAKTNPDLIDGLIYKPDAIPLSQYRRRATDPESLAALSNVDVIAGDGQTERSYYAAIYSGSTSGVYFKVAAQICDMMSRTFERHRVHCVPLRSQGVGSNIRLMKEGRVQLAIVQSNNNWEAQKGIAPIPGARSVMSLHDEMGLLVVRNDSDIESIADLRGKRINIGPEGSASRELWLELLSRYKLTLDDLDTVYGVAQDYNELGICENYIDAFGLWIGHPASLIEDTLGCGARVVGMGGPLTDEMVKANQYFFNQVLPAKTYSAQEEAISSYGFKASLIAYEPADPYVVYWITRIVHENIDRMKEMYPTFRSVVADDMFKKGNFLPFHKGAACYWETDAHACDWQPYYQQADPHGRRKANYTYKQ
ncbi:TAXI family TRAP transporter solute-binding subunit [Thalassospira xiamenensis]|uniref:TAXI family TRAP transporter solute-binding subunit n=1 Tax=Thalassospira xiamenensis TaxID=220697 RepID=UPI001FFFE44E|nr:TAXI family TRAP transporter solute-binding subunit [Thalassospira xiamenensis]MCK2169188.1 TAXI family TRAP transporter solute-binding subunit [Thalassospira xiamenensis]